ncbi:flavin-containing monooxygenase FMO GS-OX-like 2 [Andrographis paniculata]|uniref:flavin-containing monooxygenase FMO GS-OX-like 2 n=1 Tax=Andrographis paniculata TaxID=175694 RepID=UPI0021E84CDB|nr:flavin-containing monooxygenase FMO GS-OX-like 2 [Andrographis paniculata]
MAPPCKVAVIGAGVGGLTAARAIRAEGLHVTVYEKSDRLGGVWIYDPRVESDPLGLDPNRETVHSSIYPSLRTNLPRQLMGFPDYPFGSRSKNPDSRIFPGHQEVLDFIKGYADFFQLVELIRFNTEVERVEQAGPEWVVQSRLTSSGSVSEEMFDAVVVCSGHYSQPRLAQIPGMEKWPGEQIHSHNYRGPEPFQDKIVVVIGSGPSAIDISAEIAEAAKEVHLSSRAPDTTATKLDFGDNIWQHSKIEFLDESGLVSFEDGACLFPDIIFHCTGYHYSFPFLKTDGIVSVDDNRVGPLYKHIFPPKLAPSLSFVGLAFRAVVVQLLHFQATWIARVLSSKTNLPSEEEMQADVERHYQLMELKGIPKHYTHAFSLETFFEYIDSIAVEAGLEQVGEEVKSICKSYFSFVIENGLWKAKNWRPDWELQQGN